MLVCGSETSLFEEVSTLDELEAELSTVEVSTVEVSTVDGLEAELSGIDAAEVPGDVSGLLVPELLVSGLLVSVATAAVPDVDRAALRPGEDEPHAAIRRQPATLRTIIWRRMRRSLEHRSEVEPVTP
jgi:hypothetical protein